MPQSERLRVWKGMLKKTSGGLTKADLMKNKRGKIVSKKKSAAAKKNKENNLGQWLRSKGEHFLSKGLKAENIVKKGKAGRKAFAVPEEKKEEAAAAKPKPPKPKKKAAEAAKPKPKKKAAPAVAKPKPKPAPPKISKTAPMKPGEKKDLSKVSVGNIFVQAKDAVATYTKKAWDLEDDGMSRKAIIKKLGKPPKGFKW